MVMIENGTMESSGLGSSVSGGDSTNVLPLPSTDSVSNDMSSMGSESISILAGPPIDPTSLSECGRFFFIVSFERA